MRHIGAMVVGAMRGVGGRGFETPWAHKGFLVDSFCWWGAHLLPVFTTDTKSLPPLVTEMWYRLLQPILMGGS